MGAKLAASGGGKKKYSSNSEPNVVPFIDILLVLLIIFMVAAPLPTVDVNVDMPPPNPTPTTSDAKPTFIRFEADGTLYVDKEEVTMETLDKVLFTHVRANNPSSPNPYAERVFLRAHQDNVYADVIHIMDEIEQQGYVKVGIVSEPVKD